jgi:hypothetical protein
MGKEPNSQIEKRSRNARRKRRAQISTRTNSDGLVLAVPSKKKPSSTIKPHKRTARNECQTRQE